MSTRNCIRFEAVFLVVVARIVVVIIRVWKLHFPRKKTATRTTTRKTSAPTRLAA